MLASLQMALHFAQLGHLNAKREAMLDAWRVHPCRALAELIVLGPPTDRWAELQADVASTTSIIGLAPLIAVMRRDLHDPRLTPLILTLARLPLADAPVTRHEIGELWKRNADPSGAEQMVELARGDALGYWGAQPPVERPLPDEAKPLLEKLRVPQKLLPELIGVYREPESLPRRRVLADLLLERGDAWGELIEIQLHAPNGRREAQLRAALDARLAEPLGEAQVLDIEQGFPSRVRVSVNALAARSDAWRTVTEIRFTPFADWLDREGAFAHVAQELSSPELSRVHTVWDLPLTAFDALDPQACRLTCIGITRCMPLLARDVGERIARLSSVKTIRLVGVSPAVLDELAQTRALDGAELHAVATGWRLTWTSTLAELQLSGPHDAARWRAIFERRAERLRTTHLHVTTSGGQVSDEAVEQLGAAFGSASFDRKDRRQGAKSARSA